MLNVRQTVASAIGLAVLAGGLAGCGQRGGLYLPTAGATPSAASANDKTSNTPSATDATGNSEGLIAPAIPPGASVIPSSTSSPVDGSP